MKSPMITVADYIKPEDKGSYTELQVLKSAAGYYVGTLYNDPEGWQEPGSRDSDYFATREAAQAWLDSLKADKSGGEIPDGLRLTP
jgi:hypothetical protein